jgi:tetratricopeptide (TPR) repeat protein
MKSFSLLVFVITAAGLFAWFVLINPNNPFTNLFKIPISDLNERIVIGPYPGERDFRLLKQNHIELVLSLLDPAIPYEASLLESEKVLAEKYQLQLQSFPMSSILNHKFGSNYDSSASNAANAIASTPKKVYLHCYLGIHRAQVVKDLLAGKGIQAGKYTIRSGERDKISRLLDAADATYNSGNYQNTIDILAQIDENQLTKNAQLLRAWSFYRAGNLNQADYLFNAFLSINPDYPQAKLGLGYCAYRKENYATAEQLFLKVLGALPNDADALGGLGLIYYRTNRLTEAAARLAEALALNPGNQELKGVLTRVKCNLTPASPQQKSCASN